MTEVINEIPARIKNVAIGGHVCGTEDIIDDTKNKTQQQINNEVEQSLGSGGSVDERINNAKNDILGEVSSDGNTLEKLENRLNPVEQAVDNIEEIIPSQATPSNKLADKDFVNSSISTATAVFRGTSEAGLTESQFLSWANNLTKDLNDYVYWNTEDSNGNTQFKKYKYNGTQWVFEYTLNNSSFTAAEWAAIQSGMTEPLKDKLVNLPTNTELIEALNNETNARTNADTAINTTIGADSTPGTIKGRIKVLEDAVGSGGSIDTRISNAINVLDANKTGTSSDSKVSINVVETDGKIASVNVATNDIASADALSAEISRATAVEELLQDQYDALTQSDLIIGTLPASGQKNKIYRVPGTTSYSDYMWDGTQFVLMATYNNAIDDAPVSGSANLVKSGGVFNTTANSVGFPGERAVSEYNMAVNSFNFEPSRGKISNIFTEQYGFDKVLYQHTVTDNNIIATASTNYMLSCVAVKKGEVVRFEIIQNGEGNQSAIVPYFSEQCPTVGVTVSGAAYPKYINVGKRQYFTLEAEKDGYFVIRRFLRATIRCLCFKRVNNTALLLDNYVLKSLKVAIINGKGIDTDPISQTFGQMIEITSQAYGCSNYIEISPNDVLYVAKFTSTSTNLKNKQIGICFYDNEKNVISGVTTCYYDGSYTIGYSFVNVPSNAKYVRFSGNGRTDSLGNVGSILGISFYSKEKNHDLSLHDDITKSLLKQSEYTSNPLTIEPSILDTYNAYLRISFDKNMKADNNNSSLYRYRLTYFPNYYVGGGDVTIKYSGLTDTWTLYELPYIPLNTSPIDAFKTSEIIRAINLPTSTSPNFTGEFTVVLSKECKRIAIVFGYGSEELLNPNDILDYISEITLPVIDNTSVEIHTSNDSIKYKTLVAQAKFVALTPTIESLGLLHFSDIHGDQYAANDIVNRISELTQYINDVLCTGDSVHYYADGTSSYPQGSEWWNEESNLANKSLFVIGNHDSATPASTEYDQKEDSAAWDGKGKDWCFETYFEPYISALGYSMPSGYNDLTSPNYHACYWHKDYAAQKIRLIGLDCLHRFDGIIDPTTGAIVATGLKWTTNEQELWLIEKLNETLNSNNAAYGYSVVICCHYPLDNFDGNNEEWDDTTHKFIYNQKSTGGRIMDHKTGDVVNFHWENTLSYISALKFNMNNRVDSGYSQEQPYPNYTQGTTNNVGEILKAWKLRGGKFVAWLCGHVHVDFMWYPTKYPDMLCVVLDQAGHLRDIGTGDRNNNLKSRTCANYISIDTQNGLIKIVRIGYTMNKLMNSHQYMCYDYINKKVLNEG